MNGDEPLRSAYNRVNPGVTMQSDPQLAQMGGMLDKLYRIQHPEIERDSALARQVSGAMRVEPAGDGNGTRAGENEAADDGFTEIGEETPVDTVRDAAIAAVINGEQTVTAGSTVALRLVGQVMVAGHLLPANQLLYGTASLSGERLLITVSSVRSGESILPVSLQVYDLDGLAGIRAQGAITRDVSKASADEAISGLEVASVDPSLSAQAASAGLQFAKSLAGRKVRLVRVTIPAGYRVLLRNARSIGH
jgi:conjugative transposon TraM protein